MYLRVRSSKARLVIASSTNYAPLIGLIVIPLVMRFVRWNRESKESLNDLEERFADPEFRRLVQERAQQRGIVVYEPQKPENKGKHQEEGVVTWEQVQERFLNDPRSKPENEGPDQ
jgi:hypothetical protein